MNKDKTIPTLSKTAVSGSLRRVNVYDKNGNLIGQDYQRDNGDWMHKWVSVRHEGFDKFSWKGRVEGEDMDKWTYKEI